MRRYARLWVIIADGEHARVVSPRPPVPRVVAPLRPEPGVQTVLTMDSPVAHLRASDLETDRPGRSFESASPTRHAITPKHDPHQLAKEAFLRSVAERIDTEASAKAFEHLLLVAPDYALHQLREALSPSTAAMVVGTINRDLTKIPDHALADHLTDWI
jgi:protein required for attachment to host cells